MTRAPIKTTPGASTRRKTHRVSHQENAPIEKSAPFGVRHSPVAPSLGHT
jgi:hypothetical protein